MGFGSGCPLLLPAAAAAVAEVLSAGEGCAHSLSTRALRTVLACLLLVPCSWSTVTPGLPVMQKRYAGWLDVSDIAAAVLSMSISDRKEPGLVSAVSAAFSEDAAHTAIACINRAAGNPFWAGGSVGGWVSPLPPPSPTHPQSHTYFPLGSPPNPLWCLFPRRLGAR